MKPVVFLHGYAWATLGGCKVESWNHSSEAFLCAWLVGLGVLMSLLRLGHTSLSSKILSAVCDGFFCVPNKGITS